MDPLNFPRQVYSGMIPLTLARGFYSTLPMGREVDENHLACEDAWYRLWYKQIGPYVCYVLVG